jgi:Protein of unknown function (DUF3237)
MSTMTEALPEVLTRVRTRPLFELREMVPPLYIVGATPNAFRRIGVIMGGTFDGERLSGEVLSGGNDWQTIRTDGCVKLDVRLMLKTTDGALIAMPTDRSIRSLRYSKESAVGEWTRASNSERSGAFKIAKD